MRFGDLYDQLTAEQPEREKAWLELPPERLEAALSKSQKLSGANDSRSFRTRLKEALDSSAGLTTPGIIKDVPGAGRTPSAAQLAARAAEVRAEEDALWQSLSDDERRETEKRAAEFLAKHRRFEERERSEEAQAQDVKNRLVSQAEQLMKLGRVS